MRELAKESSSRKEEILKNIKRKISKEFKGYRLEGSIEPISTTDKKTWLFTISNENEKTKINGAFFLVNNFDYETIKKSFVNTINKFNQDSKIKIKVDKIINQFNEAHSEYQIEFSGVQEGFDNVKGMYMFTILKEEDTAIHGVTINVEVLDYEIIKSKIMAKINQCRLGKII